LASIAQDFKSSVKSKKQFAIKREVVLFIYALFSIMCSKFSHNPDFHFTETRCSEYLYTWKPALSGGNAYVWIVCSLLIISPAILRPVPEQRKKVFYWTWTGLGIEMNYLSVKLQVAMNKK